MKLRSLGFGLIIVGALVAAGMTYFNSPQRQEPIVFSRNELLDNTWKQYKDEYIEQGTGRTLDKQKNNITTSEGQSYTLLRAAWMDDRTTFDQSYQWTKDNLQRETDKTFSWLFGQRNDASYGILADQGGANTATDGDTDIALALVFAYGRWGNDGYLADAKNLITDIWNQDVVEVAGQPVIAANNQEKGDKPTAIVNPSYFSPYAYRIFATLDPQHNWTGLVDSSYSILEKSTAANLDKGASAGLPPDWVEIRKSDGEILPPTVPGYTTNYGFDAIRTPFRIALDQQYYAEPRAKAYLERLGFLSGQWSSQRKLSAVYSHEGQTLEQYETPASYGTAIGYFTVVKPDQAEQVYDEKLKLLYNPDNRKWKQHLGYYDSNWAWFGIALHDGALPNLSRGVK